jgi:hypothetical protein
MYNNRSIACLFIMSIIFGLFCNIRSEDQDSLAVNRRDEVSRMFKRLFRKPSYREPVEPIEHEPYKVDPPPAVINQPPSWSPPCGQNGAWCIANRCCSGTCVVNRTPVYFGNSVYYRYGPSFCVRNVK